MRRAPATAPELGSRRDTRRDALFEALLDGRAEDPAVVAAAAAALGVPARDRYVVVVAAQDPAAPPDPAPALEARGLWSYWSSRPGRHVGLVRLPHREAPLPGAVPGGASVGVTSSLPEAGPGGAPVGRAAASHGATPGHASACGAPASPGAAPAGVSDAGVRGLLAVLREWTGATVGVSPAFARLSRAGRALRLAEEALRTLPAGSGGAAAFDDRLAEVLLSGRGDVAERIVTVHLGPVLAAGAERTTLLTTLRVWLDQGCSASRAAERLYCHRNTVLNRVGRVAELTGRSPESGEARLGWALALRALPYTGLADGPAPAAGDRAADGT